MRVIATDVPDVLMLEPKVFADERGFFMESYNKRVLADLAGIRCDFVQDNYSRSANRVLRGLHYQVKQPQGKLIRVLHGVVFDVAVDLRRSSATFGRWVGFELSDRNRRMAWIPQGFAHGFLVLSESADVFYKTSDYYAPEHERTILWNDNDLDIRWPDVGAPIVSSKDRAGGAFRMAETFL